MINIKRLVVSLITAFTILTASAQIQQFRTQAFTYKQENYEWADWESSDILVEFDFDTDIVAIYSPVPQYYKIISQPSSGYDSDGEGYITFSFIDQDGDRGTMKLMVRKDGRSEIYIIFSNVTWCYTVRRT